MIRRDCDHEHGFTLVELLLAVVILGIIAAPLSLGFITGLRFIGRSDERFNDSRSALISAAYFASDVAGREHRRAQRCRGLRRRHRARELRFERRERRRRRRA